MPLILLLCETIAKLVKNVFMHLEIQCIHLYNSYIMIKKPFELIVLC